MEKPLDFPRAWELLGKDLFARFVGVELLEIGPGRARTRLVVEERHRNGVGIIHGGAIFTLADIAFAAAANSHGRTAVALNASVSFVTASRGAVLLAEAVETSRGRRTATYHVEVRDDLGEKVALFQGLAYIKERPTLKEGRNDEE
ncbi:MAG TPA: hotdog fold thioesterase [Syntrophales bacterium]|nr:hotdog fold thioesterase [Syntrophales bacterium]HPC00330.1 hotdog fold thioesterase [Syntrophales bacterium]HPQ06535.1 hotdog fold thioesterase [Syntrophales bacterium]HRS86495.1 hotdog fold thioesterase [Syntrophales bacterium]HRV42106.1 hotdog fold thioesterase [Syntrophales bacterium]